MAVGVRLADLLTKYGDGLLIFIQSNVGAILKPVGYSLFRSHLTVKIIIITLQNILHVNRLAVYSKSSSHYRF